MYELTIEYNAHEKNNVGIYRKQQTYLILRQIFLKKTTLIFKIKMIYISNPGTNKNVQKKFFSLSAGVKPSGSVGQ